MRNKIIVVTTFISLAANQSFAGGLAEPVIEPPLRLVLPSNDWYAGIQVGPGSGEFTEPLGPDEGVAAEAAEGLFYGFHAGVQRTFGIYQLGVEIDYNTSDFVGGSLEDENDPLNGSETEIDTLAHLKLRAGRTLGRSFFYGVGGLAYGSGTIEQIDVEDTGPFLGVGADFAVSERFSVGAEILHQEFDDIDDSGYDVTLTTGQLRVSYHF